MTVTVTSDGVAVTSFRMCNHERVRRTGASGRRARSWRVRALAVMAATAVAAGCADSDGSGVSGEAELVEATVEATPLADGPCDGTFVRRELEHVTVGPGNTDSTFDGTGAGVALGDVDGDHDVDMVLGNLSGETSLWRNRGELTFVPEPLIVGRFRQPALVDVDGDRDLDVVLSSGVGPPLLLDNTGGGFERIDLEGVRAATYSMAWGDLGGDGDLDLVTGSYNAELAVLRNTPVLGSDTGVVVHDRRADGGFEVDRIAAEAQALAIRLVDVDGDGLTDVLVGNDLATPDGLWLDGGEEWLTVEPFSTTSFSTMSLDAGDVDNDGDLDVFSTDMKPSADDPTGAERYVEVEADMAAIPRVDEVQQPENVLSIADGDGFANAAPGTGLDATGWSWSGVFGDLDSDGLLDLYVVTGMRSDELFDFLPDATLTEPNRAFANLGSGSGEGWAPRPEWGLNDDAGGRGMAMADLDGDGDLDIVVNNLASPAVVFENRLCGGSNLVVDLDWAGTANPDAVGAVIRVDPGDRAGSPGPPVRRTRTIDAARGYLSGGPLTAHVGLGDTEGLVDVEVRWPDGAVSRSAGVEPDQRITITRDGS